MLLQSERDFYEGSSWALSPFLSFEQILHRLRFLIDEDLQAKPDWCKREWNINLYMLSAAATDLLDDFLARGVFSFSKISDYVSVLSKPVNFLKGVSLFTSRLRGGLRDRRLRKWRSAWSRWIIQVCEPLVRDQIPGIEAQKVFQAALAPLLKPAFPRKLLAKRARIPAAYRSQDLAHYDFVELGRKYSEKHAAEENSCIVVGLRTAGSFIAPLVCAYLNTVRKRHSSFLTLRPKSFVPPWEAQQIKKYAQSRARFIIVDEPPSTGKSLARCLEILHDFGVNRKFITIAVPIHPAGQDWLNTSLKYALGQAEIITLPPEEWYKEKLLCIKAFRTALLPYFRALGFTEIELVENECTKKINEALQQNIGKEYHVRLKKVYQVIPVNSSGRQNHLLVMGKSVGWGWLGYHAALSANRLSDYVPRVYGVKNGIMYMEWVDGNEEPNAAPQNLPSRQDLVATLAAYISRRTNQLRLAENPSRFLSSYREGGLQSIAIILSQAFGAKISKLKRGWVRSRLEKLSCPAPCLLDARMMPGEWVHASHGLVKTDFEHHGFSKTASHNIVDPAYDLASAMFEFELTDREQEALIKHYIQATKDERVSQRLFYYKLLCGSEAMSDALGKLNKVGYESIYQQLNERFVRAWNFLVAETMRYTARYCAGKPITTWRTPMFVMDIDDVLDKVIFGFPSTTERGIRTLSLLRAHQVCSVINTARSLKEVQDYCRHYGFAGGIAEYGSVLWDAGAEQENVLVSPQALAELSDMRDALRHVPGVFINPFYSYSIRAYSYNREKTIPIPDATIGELFQRLNIRHLKPHRTYIDTAILDHNIDKGKALLRLKEWQGIIQGKIAAVGDSEADLPMLKVVDCGFLVSNSSVELKRQARHFGITVVKAFFQTGLYEAAVRFVHDHNGKKDEKAGRVLKKLKHENDSMWDLIQIADKAAYLHWLRLFDKNMFEIFQE
ncbi:HAD family phosphatase [candidate division KSB1 bacterium]|nr:HAD family phosphatase [candidate division KSB1 bacterium]